MITRELPNDLLAERHLLGCCLIDGAVTVGAAVNAGLNSGSFFEPTNGKLFALLVDMVSAGETVTTASVYQELVRRKLMDSVGGSAAFCAISSETSTTVLASQVIGVVAELASVRKAIRIAGEMTERAYAYRGSGLADVISRPIAELLSLSNSDGKPEPSWAETIDEAVAVADEIIANKGKPLAASIPFPWRQMNDLFGPMQRGQLIIIAARTSIGKSSLARPIACHAATHGHKVYFDTLEVQPVKVAMQMAATLSRIGVRQLGSAHDGDQQDFKKALIGLKRAGITMSRKDRALAQIIGRTKALAAQGNVDIAFIDHGGYIDEVSKAGEKAKVSAIGIVTKALKNLAVDLDIPVVLLWQLNRGSEKDQNREPVLSDLKDSGSVEEDADKVIFIHRPTDNPITGRAQPSFSTVDECPRFFQNVIQAKGRDDGTSLLSFYFDRQTATFDPIQR